jgi:hypothetical protein
MPDDGNLVLCGPIVRRADRSSVSVFVATRRACTVELTADRNGVSFWEGAAAAAGRGRGGPVGASVAARGEGRGANARRRSPVGANAGCGGLVDGALTGRVNRWGWGRGR